jgi:hypothetical protein
VSEVHNLINSYNTDIVLTTPQSSPNCLADCFWSTTHTLPSPTLWGTTYFKSFGIIQFVCCRDSVYTYPQDSVQFSVGIKDFTKTRLRRDIIYSFEDLLGTPHLLTVMLYFTDHRHTQCLNHKGVSHTSVYKGCLSIKVIMWVSHTHMTVQLAASFLYSPDWQHWDGVSYALPTEINVFFQLLFHSRAIFLMKIGSGTHSNSKFGRRRGGISYINARGKKVPERRSGSRPFEKELMERHSGTKIHLVPPLFQL